jgi:hypothetical protein
MIQPVLFALLLAQIPIVLTFFVKDGQRWRHPVLLWGNTSVISFCIVIHLIFTGIANLFTPFMGLIGMGVSLQFLYLFVGTQKWGYFGRYVMSLSFGFLLLGVFSPNAGPVSLSDGFWVPIHATLILIGLCSFVLHFPLCLLYLIVQYRLKAKKLSDITSFPSLNALDKYAVYSMLLGFFTLTLGMSSGLLLFMEQNQSWDITTYITIALWLWYLGGIYFRYILQRRHNWTAWFGVIGFVVVSFLVILATFAGGTWHLGGSI